MAKVARISAVVLEEPKPKNQPAARNRPARELSQKASAGTTGERAVEVASCLRRIGQGNEDAARELMDRLYPLVLKLVRAYLPRRASEEDLVQTVFMKVFANLKQYSGQVPVEHWVSRIAVNTCLNEIKAQKIRPEWRWADLSEEEQYVVEALSATESEEPAISGESAKELLNRLLSGLAPQDRLVIRLLHLEERSVAEIKKITGWNTAVVKVRAFRARKKLKSLLAQLEHDGQL
ncbi:MAG TPA: RNA polymerase sigma factor [Verrucomicrobiae bacterium]|nr:RNA polymerase sigma factor [Verrucomicrobiae bacterium]